MTQVRAKGLSASGIASPRFGPALSERRQGVRRHLAIVGPVLFAALVVLLSPRPGVWLDEAATVSATSRSWHQVWILSQHQDRSLVGYYAATKVLADAAGWDPLTAGRAISAGAYVAATGLVALLAQRLWGSKAALASGLAVAVLPAAAASAVNARPEGLSVFLIAAYLCAALTYRRMTQVACALVACSVYALNVLYLPLALVIPVLAHRRPSRRDSVIAVAVSAVGAGWLLTCASQQRQVGWIHTNALTDVLASFTRVGVSAPTSRTGESFVTGVSMTLGIGLTMVALAMIVHRRTRVVTAVLLVLWVFPPLAATCAVMAGKDIFVERYFTPSVIGMALVVGYGASRLEGARSRLRVGVPLAVLAAACVPSFVSSHAPDGHWGEDLASHQLQIRAAGLEHVAFAAPRNRAVLFAPGHPDPSWRDASWWVEARSRGELWGPPLPAGPGTRVVVVDTRSARALPGVPGCTFAQRAVLHREARFTTLGVECAR